uniref:Macaca fascicularis brain cDNA clone: QtrA-14316, similar to human KIAA0738 gene product (KIAA0738), mRNA, RefSeq: NM_014719.1 n=1 Tax=Macaca fascicularis TaxID=9541 RepID=I7GAU9_MACFA|nr:unnamed protein product [Macaca fascicularis]
MGRSLEPRSSWATVNHDGATVLQPGGQSETLSLKKQQKKEETENKKISLKIK